MVFRVNKNLQSDEKIPHSLTFGHKDKLGTEYRAMYPRSILYQLTLLCATTTFMLAVAFAGLRRRIAVRVDDYNAGGFGGAYDNVELFTAYGFRSEIVFHGEWNSIDNPSLRWKSDTELEISVRRPAYHCASTLNVKVHCSPK